MAHYQLILAYDGTRFSGSQRQARARTVQGEVEAALRRIGWQASSLLSAGRTDAGVHASGQVVSFQMEWNHGLEDLLKAVNANLPEDIAAWQVRQVPTDFHPRFSARSRRYQYTLVCQPERNPLVERFAWRVWPAPELERLQAAAAVFIGRHDFRAFGSPPRAGASTVRTVVKAQWLAISERLVYEVEADAFLYHMVRRMVSDQVLVGQGRMEVEAIENPHVAEAVRYMDSLPLESNVLFMTVMASNMPFVGRG